MITLLIASIISGLPASADLEFRLDNGLSVILDLRPDLPAAVVALGVRTGVDDELEGYGGLAHLAEHVFLYGATKSYPAYRAFDRLAGEGPIGSPYRDVNAETLWNLTYYYAARPANSVELALEVFAEKLNGVNFTAELLAEERKKVLAEIDYATENLRKFPLLRQQMEDRHRHPKAGIATDVESLDADDVGSFLATHYRPERAILLVSGAFDVDRVRGRVEALFGPLQAREAVELVDRPISVDRESVIATYPLPGVSPREGAAIALAGEDWESRLREREHAFVEVAPGGRLRVVLPGGDEGLLRETREALHEPMSEARLDRARARAGADARSILVADRLLELQAHLARSPEARTGFLIQASINRLRLEAEGGRRFLDLLGELSREEVAAAARTYLTAEAERISRLRP